jgi:hypothetical protein
MRSFVLIVFAFSVPVDAQQIINVNTQSFVTVAPGLSLEIPYTKMWGRHGCPPLDSGLTYPDQCPELIPPMMNIVFTGYGEIPSGAEPRFFGEVLVNGRSFPLFRT